MPVLETKRTRIRPLVSGDLESCHRLYLEIGWVDAGVGDAENMERWGRRLEWSVRNYEELARLIQPPYGDRAIVRKDSGEFVGLVGLVPAMGPFGQLIGSGGVKGARFTPEVGLFWAVSPTWQRQGYATEAASAVVDYAFGALQLARIVATTEYDNEPSMAVMRKLGMRIERNPYPEPHWFQVVGILEYQATST